MKLRKFAIAAVAAIIVIVGLFQFDVVRQNAEIILLQATHKRWELKGTLSLRTMYSPALRQTRRVYVYTPLGYNQQSDKMRRYPVLYLLHGEPDLNQISWVRYGRAPDVVDRLIALGRIPPMILVCPDGKGVGTFGDSEYLDSPNPANRNRAGAKIETFIVSDLTKWVDANYRTIPSPSGRWLGGVSEGGYGAVNIGLQHPDTFSVLIALSGFFTADPSGDARPIWGYRPTAEQLRDESPTAYVNGPNPKWNGTAVFLGSGLNERSFYNKESNDFALKNRKAAGIPVITRSEKGRHSWDLWRSLIGTALLDYASRIPR